MAQVPSHVPEGLPPGPRPLRQNRPALLLLGTSVGLVVAIVFVLGAIITKRVGAADEDGARTPAGCLSSDLRITADPPAVADALLSVVGAATGDDCPVPKVTAEASAITAAALREGGAPGFDIWVPDSDLWPAYVADAAASTGSAPPQLVVGDTVASTPIVFAAPETVASALGAQEPGFAMLATQQTPSFTAMLPDPASVASSSAALLALQTTVGGDARVFTGVVLSFARTAPTTADALDTVTASTTPTVAVTTEQVMWQHAESPQEGSKLVSIYPSDIKAAVGIPLVTVAEADPETVGAADFITAAMADAGDLLAEFGLRDAAGRSPDAERVAIAPIDSTNQYEAHNTWRVLTAPSRMLALNDVSGSMSQTTAGGMTRIDLFEQAAVRAINSLSEDSSLAVWVFSSRRIGGQDWQEIVPFGSLGDPAHKQRAVDTANDLDSHVGGGTGLYDSVLAAVKYMKETYVPGEVNLVLLNTDGYNEDDDGLDLDGLLAQLEELHDPATPVPVIAIGYGPDTDQDALEKIAAATEGAAYQALQPTDISTVLVDAVTQRGCRPYCS